MPSNPDRDGSSWRHRLVIPVGVIFVALMLALILIKTAPSPEKKPREQQARLVEVVPAERGAWPALIPAWGEVMPARAVALQPRVSGTVIEIDDALNPGVHVQEGDLLLRIDPADYALAVSRAKAALAQAKAALAREEGNQRVAKREFELVGAEVSDEEKALMLRRPQLESARADVDSAQANLDEARLNLQRTRLKAPFDALVLESLTETGAQISSNTTVARLVGTEEYWLELSVPVSMVRWIKVPGQDDEPSEVRLYHDGVWGDAFRTGEVLRLRGDLAETGRMARLLVRAPDPLALSSDKQDKPPLLLGSFLRGEIIGREVEDVIRLERAWLRDNDRVWIMDADDKMAIRDVAVIFRGESHVYVRGDIGDGDRIVVSEMSVPADGMPLRVDNGNGDDSE
jgi:RND family efflux transporter MFP subunit